MLDNNLRFGAQYYRTPNPPEVDWEKDLREMKAQGMNTVRLWAMWSWIHTSDSDFDFSHLNKLMNLCREIGLKALVQVILENAPAWLVHRHPEARYHACDGQPIQPMGRPNTPGGGWPGLCLDNTPAREAAERFMSALAQNFAGHEALLGYDVWNEVWFELDGYIGDQYYCYCPATVSQFRLFLRAKYGGLDGLCKAWHRRYTKWNEVEPPRYWGGYPDWLDWIKFRLANQGDLLRWRVAALRAADPDVLLASHGLPNTLGSMASMLTDDWRNAEIVDLYGLSCFPLWFNYDNAEVFKVHDLIRGACNGKTFWTAETQAGPSGEGLMHSRSPKPEDIRLWNWISLASGAKGVLYWQWRPELLGPESPGFGLCSLDGTPTERTGAAAWFAEFGQRHPELVDSEPVKGEVAILVLPESQLFCHISDRNAGKYAQAVKGAYRALSQAGYQVDFAKIDQIHDYQMVYMPFPLMIEREHARKIANYVWTGGKLVSEACPGLFGDGGYTQVVNPGHGLHEVFGARAENGPETLADDGPSVKWNDRKIACVVHRQHLTPLGAATLAEYEDGGPAVTCNEFGLGNAVLIGTYPGICVEWGKTDAEAMLAEIAGHLGVRPQAQATDPDVWVRLQKCGENALAYVVNLAVDSREVTVRLSSRQDVCVASDLVTGEEIAVGNGELKLTLNGHDARLLRLDSGSD